jgi:hypothetical protein
MTANKLWLTCNFLPIRMGLKEECGGGGFKTH